MLYKYIDYLVDDNPRKIGTYSPEFNIPVYSSTKIYEDKPDIVLILAWRYKDEILKRLADVNTQIIIPLPDMKIVN